LLGDLILDTPVGVMAARFHKGLARVIAQLVCQLCGDRESDVADASRSRTVRTVALTGGVFQNRALLEQVEARLVQQGFEVLLPRDTPCNDAGLALGQALVDAARQQS